MSKHKHSNEPDSEMVLVLSMRPGTIFFPEGELKYQATLLLPKEKAEELKKCYGEMIKFI